MGGYFLDFDINREAAERLQMVLSLTLLLIFVLLYSTFRNITELAIVMLANIVGLIPIMWATGTGADVTQRIAAPPRCWAEC
ncbi:MAG: hypothetical protein ACXV74_12775 [Methylobacter sp.]